MPIGPTCKCPTTFVHFMQLTHKCSLKFIVVIICITHYHRHICVRKRRVEECAIEIWFGEKSECDAEHTGVFAKF